MGHLPDTVLILSTPNHEHRNSNVRGTGGWLAPHEREALDWMVLVKFLGWRVEVKALQEFEAGLIVRFNVKWIIFTGDPDQITSELWDQISYAVKHNKILFISQGGQKNGQFSEYAGVYISDAVQSGRLLLWRGVRERKWECRNEVQMQTLSLHKGFYEVATLMGKPIIAAKTSGFGKITVLSFHPGEARDKEGAFTALLKHLLIYSSQVPVAWFDWKNTIILRMDDPGSMEAVYHEGYRYRKLNEKDWRVIGNELEKRNGRMSIGYVPGWVDDGDLVRGNLFVKGELVPRAKGNVHRSPMVSYVSTNNSKGDINYDYVAEFKGIQALRNKGLAEVELHGYTHLTPDRDSWANATDRYSNVLWYREFGERDRSFLQQNVSIEHPLNAGLKMLSSLYATSPSTLICPGDEFTNDVVERALVAGLMMISSYYLAVKIGEHMCWGTHICAPYLDKPDPAWFDSELPVVGYFHDADISCNGTEWFSKCLMRWEAEGAKHFIDFREVESVLNRYVCISKSDGILTLGIEVINTRRLIKPRAVNIFDPKEKSEQIIHIDNDRFTYII